MATAILLNKQSERQARLTIRPGGFAVNPAQMQSGAANFDGEGYPHHGLLRKLSPAGFDYRGMTFRSKTIVAEENVGQMELVASELKPASYSYDVSFADSLSSGIESTIQSLVGMLVRFYAKDAHLHRTWPKETFPKSIKVWPWKQGTLNAVSLSGPGIRAHLGGGAWAGRTKPYWISIMPIKKDTLSRYAEIVFIKKCLLQAKSSLGPFGIEINISCPNEGKEKDEYLAEVYSWLTALGEIGVPIVIKISATEDVYTIRDIVASEYCDGITIPNTLPWGKSPRVDWKRLSGDGISPLVKRGLDPQKPGGYAGPELFGMTCEWLSKARAANIKKHICAGGWVMRPDQPELLFRAGADSIAIGDAFILRFWKLRELTEACYRCVYGDKKWQEAYSAAIA